MQSSTMFGAFDGCKRLRRVPPRVRHVCGPASAFVALLFLSILAASIDVITATQQIIPGVCPDHLFHKLVNVQCVYDPQAGQKDFPPLLRVSALSVINGKLNSTILRDQGIAFAPSMTVDIPSYQRDDFTDPTQFINVQEQSGAPFVDRLVGIAIDGIPIYTAVGEGGYDMLQPSGSFADVEPLVVDECGGTFGPTPDGIRYHYRTIPACVLPHTDPRRTLDPSMWAAQDLSNYSLNEREYQIRRLRHISDVHDLLLAFAFTPGKNFPQVVGWTLQGHPIYSPFNERGLLHENLDNCNGKFDKSGKYGYYSRPSFPYLVGCIGPGLFSLAEERATLEMLPTATGSHRRYNACPGGYVPSSNFASEACEPCPAGRYSSATYLKAGQEVSSLEGCRNICPAGNFCPAASTKPIKCPAGRYGSQLGLTSAECSGPCKKGYYCPIGSTRPDAYPCGLGSMYCPEGTPVRLPVVRGWYSIPEDINENWRSDQARCGPGTYCSEGFRHPCPAGRYGTENELFTANCTSHCPVGHYCPLSSPDPIKCPAGTFGSVISLASLECSGKCKPGYYCPQGSIKADQIPCAPGIYGAEAGLTTKECSPECENMGAPNSTSSAGTKFCEARSCAAGYYCPFASVSANQLKCGGASMFCPPSSVVPTPVSVGYYTVGDLSRPENMQVTTRPVRALGNSDSDGAAAVDMWGEDGDASVRYSQIICEPGFYCIAGVRNRCPPGYYGAISGLSTATCSGPCQAGYTCPWNSFSAKQQSCGIDARVYCPEGSYVATTVPPGYYSLGDDHTTRESILPCPPGSWCQDGVKRLCPAGRFSVNGSPTDDCDGLCANGYWCSEGSNSATQFNCPAGRYGHLGMSSAACKGSCKIGYYCPVNSFSPTQVECGNEMFYCPHGSGNRIPVSSGYFSSGGNQTTRWEQIKCDVGTYWGTPPEGKKRTNRCPDTTAP